MTKNIIIEQDGTERSFSAVEKINAKKVEGGTENWVWEEGTNLGVLHVSEDGTYTAADDGYYGYSTVVVDTIGGASFVAGDDESLGGVSMIEGNEYLINKDAATGGIQPSLLPSLIRITTTPTKMTYQDGEAINTAGMVVQAYSADGNTWGEPIPNNSLELNPTNASLSKVQGNIATDGTLRVGYKVQNSAVIRTASEYEEFEARDTVLPVFAFGVQSTLTDLGETYRGVFIASRDSFTVRTNESGRIYELPAQSATYNGQTVYYGGRLSYQSTKTITEQTTPLNRGTDVDTAYLCWLAVYGTRVSEDKQSIDISWRRPGDEKKLHAILEITVTA